MYIVYQEWKRNPLNFSRWPSSIFLFNFVKLWAHG